MKPEYIVTFILSVPFLWSVVGWALMPRPSVAYKYEGKKRTCPRCGVIQFMSRDSIIPMCDQWDCFDMEKTEQRKSCPCVQDRILA